MHSHIILQEFLFIIHRRSGAVKWFRAGLPREIVDAVLADAFSSFGPVKEGAVTSPCPPRRDVPLVSVYFFSSASLIPHSQDYPRPHYRPFAWFWLRTLHVTISSYGGHGRYERAGMMRISNRQHLRDSISLQVLLNPGKLWFC